MTEFDAAAWREELEGHRAEKDRMFAEHPQSPVPTEDREGFDGLPYFDPDPEYRVTATVEVHSDPEPVEMEVSAGPPQRYLRVATLQFDLDGEPYSLAGYRQEQTEAESLFVPFRDKTTGQQTYEGGRYMELQADREIEDGAEIPLDFNLAYTPFCAFSETFSCPLPPEENWLETVIPAGEQFERA